MAVSGGPVNNPVLRMEPVCAEIVGYENYGSVDSSQPGPCGTHRYRALITTPDGVTTPHVIMGSVEQCWPVGLHVVPLPIGRAIMGVRIGGQRFQWFYRETPLVGPCNPGGG